MDSIMHMFMLQTIMWMIGMICPMLIFMIVRTAVTENWFRPVERQIVLGELTPIVVNYETQVVYMSY